jgi:hypothetical protein
MSDTPTRHFGTWCLIPIGVARAGRARSTDQADPTSACGSIWRANVAVMRQRLILRNRFLARRLTSGHPRPMCLVPHLRMLSPCPLTGSFDRRAARPLGVAAAFFVNGFLIGGWALQIPPLMSRLEIGETTLGLLILVLGLGALVAMPWCGFLIGRLGSRPVLLPLAFLATPGLLPVALLPMRARRAGAVPVRRGGGRHGRGDERQCRLGRTPARPAHHVVLARLLEPWRLRGRGERRAGDPAFRASGPCRRGDRGARFSWPWRRVSSKATGR